MSKVKAKVKKYDWKDIGERMFKTFIQGVLSYLIISINGITDTNDIVVKSLLLGCIASGLSAVMNVIVQELEMQK
ncbi:MAG: hypothetical protein J6W64_09190 [Bacilli bacterium]|nr:hypothetical protein [Bacilli bacterium]MBO7712734.1 hypothetical protein [Methanobrevibacter sp.]MBO7712792.1 hypothetical protein [Methanobrevibacter sp.]